MWLGRRHAASQECEEASRSKCQTCGKLAVLYEAVTQVSLNKSKRSQIRTAKPLRNCTLSAQCFLKFEKKTKNKNKIHVILKTVAEFPSVGIKMMSGIFSLPCHLYHVLWLYVSSNPCLLSCNFQLAPHDSDCI